MSTSSMVQASPCLKCSNFWVPSLIKEYFRCWWAEVYFFSWGIRQTGMLLFIFYPLYLTHSLTVFPVTAVMVNASNNSFSITEKNPGAHRVSAWEEHNRDYGMREMCHRKMQRDCKRQKGRAPPSAREGTGTSWWPSERKCWIQEC